MNKENAKDYLPLVQALAEGKTIQYNKSADPLSPVWDDRTDLAFDGPASDYRIKPELGEIFVVIDKHDTGSYLAFLSEDDAKEEANHVGLEVRRYREVIE